MSIASLLDLIKSRFSPTEGKALLASLQQDPLVWQFVKNEASSMPYFEAEGKTIGAYTPGKIAAYLITQTSGITPEALVQPDFAIPEPLRNDTEQAYQTVLNTGLPPADLKTAGMLALTLRERYLREGSWKGISKQLINDGSQPASDKPFQIWRTPIACLYTLGSDFNGFIGEFFASNNHATIHSALPIFIHSYLANPSDHDTLLNQLFALVQNLSIDWQLESLEWLETFYKPDLRTVLAENLVQTRKNIDAFAQIFAELEAFKAQSAQGDPLERQIRYSLPEDVNRLAAFYYYCGNPDKASETYQTSSDLLDFISAQTRFQSLASKKKRVPSARWLEIVRSVPNSKQARLYYIQSLVDDQNFDEAEKNLQSLPPSPEKQLINFKINSAQKSPAASDSLTIEQLETPPIKDTSSKSNYYVHHVKMASIKESLRSFLSAEEQSWHLQWVEKSLDEKFNDPEVVQLSRDIYEKHGHLDKAIELTAYLNQIDPENHDHKRTLARLYSAAKRWQDAFNILQRLSNDDSPQEIVDLERFAEASLRTARLDMAALICHNILKRDAQNTKALILLGESYLEKGDIVKAVQHMERVVKMIPGEPEPWLTLAHIWELQNQPDRSFEILNKAFATLPNDTAVMRKLGQTLLARKSTGESVNVLQKAFTLDPTNIEGRLALADAQYQLGQYDEALQLLAPFQQDYADHPIAARLLGYNLIAMGRKLEAEPVLFSAANHFPEDEEMVLTVTDLILQRAEASHEKGLNEPLNPLKELLENALGKIRNNQQVRLHLADIDRLQGDHQKALDVYSALTEEGFHGDANIQWRLPYGLGKSAIALGNQEMGLAALKEASSKQPEYLFVLHALAEAYQAADLKDKGQKSAKAALMLAQLDIDNILWYANFVADSNHHDEAVAALKEANRLNPEQPLLQLRLSKALISTGSHDEAKENIEKLVHNNAASANVLHEAAYTAIHLNQLDLAISALEKSAQLQDQTNPTLLMELAISHTLAGQWKNALDVLNLNQQTFNQHPQLALLKSDLLSRVEQFELAAFTLDSINEVAEEKLDRDPKDGEKQNQSPLLYTFDFTLGGYFYRQGQLNRVLGNLTSAQAHLSKALAISPEDLKVRNASVGACMSGFDFEHALKVATEEIEDISPTKTTTEDYLDLVCHQVEILFNQGHFEQGKEQLDVLRDKNPAYPRYLALQSCFAAQGGELELAEELFKQAGQRYHEGFENLQSFSIEGLFRQIANLRNLAKAAYLLADYRKAIFYHREISNKLNNQPWENQAHLLVLTKAAEAQRIANALIIRAHAPGEEFLSIENYKAAQSLLASLKSHLTNDQSRCIEARVIAAFDGQWPLHLNVDACLNNSEEAAAVLLGSNDENLIRDILDTYPTSPEVLQAYGIYALKHNKPDGSSRVEQALEADIANPANHALLAMLNSDEPARAINSIDTALSFWPEEAEWHAFAADLYKRIGNPDISAQHMSQAIDAQPENAHYWQKRAEIKIQKNMLAQAKNDLETSVSFQANNPTTWVTMANVNRRLGNVTEALHNFETASKLDPDNLNICAHEVEFLLEQNKNKEAEHKAKTILQNMPDSETLQVLLAQAQAKQGKFDDALFNLAAALNRNPQSTALAIEAIKIRKNREGIEAALPDLIHLAQDYPEDPAILTTLTEWLIETNRLREAEETVKIIARIIPEKPEVHLMLGRLQRKNGQLDQAVTHFSEAIALEPTLIEAYIELGKTYQERRDLESAIDIFQKATLANASDPRPYYHAGMALKDCKDYSGAEAMLKQAKRYSPDDPNIARQLGVITALNLINTLRETR